MNHDIQLWGGVECTVNRVGDTYFDQIERTGHGARIEDLDDIASLGLASVRYPVLWEHAERAPGVFDFAWPDERLARLRALGVRPIVGLLHHGSGPRWTNLLDPGFAEGFASYAAEVARRYPWIDDWTPINEPLTTARFSALYGHWYPHAKSDEHFVQALLTEVRAIAMAMRAIRRVNPRARLVQTEDTCFVLASEGLRYQARFENERRWLSLDLLAGRVRPGHPLHAWLLGVEAPAEELARLAASPCQPDVIGLNYYVTSDRWLDEHLELYPKRTHGGNGKHAYADVEAVRVREAGVAGHERILMDTWKRYRIPVALTEVHIGCTVDERIRWFASAFRAARAARRRGADVCAVTAWAMFGAMDWDSLLTRADGSYEAGLFDVSSGRALRTELAAVVEEFARRGETTSPIAATAGWWHRADRWLYDCPDCRAQSRIRRGGYTGPGLRWA